MKIIVQFVKNLLPPKSPKDQAEPSQNTKTKSWFWKPNLPYYTLTVGPG